MAAVAAKRRLRTACQGQGRPVQSGVRPANNCVPILCRECAGAGRQGAFLSGSCRFGHVRGLTPDVSGSDASDLAALLGGVQVENAHLRREDPRGGRRACGPAGARGCALRRGLRRRGRSGRSGGARVPARARRGRRGRARRADARGGRARGLPAPPRRRERRAGADADRARRRGRPGRRARRGRRRLPREAVRPGGAARARARADAARGGRRARHAELRRPLARPQHARGAPRRPLRSS